MKQFDSFLRNIDTKPKNIHLNKLIINLLETLQNLEQDLMYFPFWALKTWCELISCLAPTLKDDKNISEAFYLHLTHQGSDL